MNLLQPALAMATVALAACAPRPAPEPAAPVQTLASSATEPMPLPAAADDSATAPRAHQGGAFGVGIRPTGSRAQGITP
ncbi:MAG TPA: hypothetical protein VF169_20930 [Albitalea sp.]|uniref:hypothetical protein n=1 Tax=Piscinibacter sp. TaxID=1903157 RepID=UPI002ED608C8